MTDNNADETDGQNSKLSRRTALGLMGASAVGGAAATSAFSQLTADRPIDVSVTDTEPDMDTADTGTSDLQITNYSGNSISAQVETTGAVSLQSSSGATVSGTGPWTVDSIGDTSSSSPAELTFAQDSSGGVAGDAVDFEVTGFSNTNGYGVTKTQPVNVWVDNNAFVQYLMAEGSGTSVGDAVGSNSLDFDSSDSTSASWVADSGYVGGYGVDLSTANLLTSSSTFEFNTDLFAGALTIKVPQWITSNTNTVVNWVSSNSGTDAFVVRTRDEGNGNPEFHYPLRINGNWQSATSSITSSTGTKVRVGFKYDYDSANDNYEQVLYVNGNKQDTLTRSNPLAQPMVFQSMAENIECELDNVIQIASNNTSDIPTDSDFSTDYNNQPWS